MFIRLLPFFTLLPIIELYLLIKIGSWIGAGMAILLVLGTGILGAALARQQGFKVWMKIRHTMQQGIFPADDMIDGLLIFGAGLVLITPGVITDVIGFLLLIPVSRVFFRNLLKTRFSGMIQRGDSDFSDVFRHEQKQARDVTDTGEDSQ
ncbi:FxsA family protein [Marispirochaeta sp.]|uniref:FxsA family protein n=1 Tax=Marispirochaeta sp. TaxID=2038653 RepID=UPI0029C8C7A8|nr:FxsA family protein [Marispirochaeta sp.]